MYSDYKVDAPKKIGAQIYSDLPDLLQIIESETAVLASLSKVTPIYIYIYIYILLHIIT